MGYSSIIDKAIAKYGKENFIVETIDICYSIEDCNNKEKYWIKYKLKLPSKIIYFKNYKLELLD